MIQVNPSQPVSTHFIRFQPIACWSIWLTYFNQWCVSVWMIIQIRILDPEIFCTNPDPRKRIQFKFLSKKSTFPHTKKCNKIYLCLYLIKERNKITNIKKKKILMSEKVPIKISLFCHAMFLNIYSRCPGSGFVSLHTDPDPTLIIQNWIHKYPDPHHGF